MGRVIMIDNISIQELITKQIKLFLLVEKLLEI